MKTIGKRLSKSGPSKNVSQANRGRPFEEMVIYTNEMYRRKGIGVIDKVPTEWQVIRGDKGKIVHAFPVRKSSVDFVGLSGGLSLAFDCKSTKNKTRFPLANIEKHQIEWLEDWREQGGLSFFLIYFEELGETYFLELSLLMHFKSTENRKSIPVHWFRLFCPRIYKQGVFLFDYLYTVNEFIKG